MLLAANAFQVIEPGKAWSSKSALGTRSKLPQKLGLTKLETCAHLSLGLEAGGTSAEINATRTTFEEREGQ